MGPKYYIGTSGWVYRQWRDVFYPPGLAQGKDLDAVYIYFNNDAQGFAIKNARTLSGKLAS